VPEAGWYNDEADLTLARWYDGEGWTEHVVLKADWEELGHAPPPPYELEAAAPLAARSGRTRLAVGSAAVAAVLLLAGVALAQGGDDDPSPRTPSDSTSQRRSADEALDDLGDPLDTSVPVGEAIDPATGEPLYGGSSSTGGSSSRTGTHATSRTRTSSATRSSGGVTRSERRVEAHSNPVTPGQVERGDESSVGNSSDKTLKDTYTPPPPPPPSEDPPSDDTTDAGDNPPPSTPPADVP
jgi:hypothetical protein